MLSEINKKLANNQHYKDYLVKKFGIDTKNNVLFIIQNKDIEFFDYVLSLKKQNMQDIQNIQNVQNNLNNKNAQNYYFYDVEYDQLFFIENTSKFNDLFKQSALNIMYKPIPCCSVNIDNFPTKIIVNYLMKQIDDCINNDLNSIKRTIEKYYKIFDKQYNLKNSEFDDLRNNKKISNFLKKHLICVKRKLTNTMNYSKNLIHISFEDDDFSHRAYFEYIAQLYKFSSIILNESELEFEDSRLEYSYKINCLAQLLSNLFLFFEKMDKFENKECQESVTQGFRSMLNIIKSDYQRVLEAC